MHPVTSAAERTALRWLLGALAIAFVVLAGVTWHRKSEACERQCRGQGSGAGELHFAGGGRLNLRTECRCSAGASTGGPG
jgi:hypothetical protein